MDPRVTNHIHQITSADFTNMTAQAATTSINESLKAINALEWFFPAIDSNTYDDLNNRYCTVSASNDRLKLLANTFDTNAALLSTIDQLRDYINDADNPNVLYKITSQANSKPLSDDQLQAVVPKHPITIRPVDGVDASTVAQRLATVFHQATKKS